MIDDADLLREYARDGADAAFAEVVRRHIDLVYSIALRKVGGDAHRAQDVTQLVFTDLARKARACASHPVLSAWLFKSTHFAAANVRRAEHRRRHREQQSLAMQALLSEPEPTIDWDQLRPVIDDAISALGDRDREAVMLRFFHGLDFPAIGTRLHLSTEGARARVSRAVEKLHVNLARRGISSTATAIAAVLGPSAIATAPAGMATIVTGTALTSAAATGALASFFATAPVWLAAWKLPLALTAVAALAGLAVYQPLTHSSPRVRVERESIARSPLPPPAGKTSSAVSPSASVVSPPLPAATNPAVLAGDEYMKKNPAVKELLAHSQRAFWASSYFPLYVALGLDDAKATAFEETLASNGATATYHGLFGADDVTFRAFPKLSDAERDARIRMLLGDPGYRQYKAYDMIGYAQAARLAAGLHFTAAPLRSDQVAPLVKIFTAAFSRWWQDSSYDPDAFWANLFAQARSVLAPAQFAPLEVARAEDIESWTRRVVAQRNSGSAPSRAMPPAISLTTHLAQDAGDPNIQLLTIAKKRAQLTEDYGAFFVAQGLTPALTAQLINALSQRVERHDDLDQAVRRERSSLMSRGVKAEHASIEAGFGDTVIGLIGPTGHAALREYDRSRPARGFVRRLAGIATVSGIPFTRDQVEQLTALLANASSTYTAGAVMTFHSTDWSAADAGAAALLSPPQFQLFQRVDARDSRSRWGPQLAKALHPGEARWGQTEPWQ